MRLRYVITYLGLSLMLLVLFYQLFFGSTSLPVVHRLVAQINQQKHQNAMARQRNQQLYAIIHDLKTGNTLLLARARKQLGYIGKNEILYLWLNPKDVTSS